MPQHNNRATHHSESNVSSLGLLIEANRGEDASGGNVGSPVPNSLRGNRGGGITSAGVPMANRREFL